MEDGNKFVPTPTCLGQNAMLMLYGNEVIALMTCRYDVSLDVNVMGVKHLCQFAKQCPGLKMFMQVSTGK